MTFLGADPRRRERTRVAFEAVALALLTALPLLAYFRYLLHDGIDRFALVGDFAGLELATRYVPSGRTLLGPYSRFGFSHPGPLYFYALAPVYALWGRTSTGIFAGACAINTASVMVIVGAVRLATTRAHAIAVALVVVAWLGAFGDACAIPWNPLVVVLPLIACLVLASLVVNGAWRALPFAVLAGAFAAQTHLSTVPAVLGIAAATGAVIALRARRGHAFGRREKTYLLLGLAVVVLAATPPLVEELLTPTGNITKLARFFASRPEPMRPLSAALADWTLATSWLPDRLLSGSVGKELDPDVFRSETPMSHVSVTALRMTLVVLVLAAGATVVALRRRDNVSLAFLGLGGVTSLLSVFALRAIVGANYMYLLFWTTAATTLVWMGVIATVVRLGADLVSRSSRPTLLRAGWWLALAALLVAALDVSTLQRAYLARETLRPAVKPAEREAYGALRAHLAQTGETPVFHSMGAWHYGLAFLLEASKDGLDARIVDRDRWIFGRQPEGTGGLAHPLHVFIQSSEAKLPIKDCVEKLTTAGDIELYTSPTDVEACPAKP